MRNTTHEEMSSNETKLFSKRLGTTSKQVTLSAMALWEAFERLNLTNVKLKSLGDELFDIFNEALQAGKRVYKRALSEFENKNLLTSKALAIATVELCNVIDLLIDKRMDNLLRLPKPPNLKLYEGASVRLSRKSIHEKFVPLISLVEERLKMGAANQEKLRRAPALLQKVSKRLYEIEKLH